MQNKIKLISINIIAGLFFTLTVYSSAYADPAKQSVVVKLDSFARGSWMQSADEWHSVCMALGLSNNLLDSKKKPNVTLFVNLEGVYLADSLEPLDNKQCGMANVDMMLKSFQSAGGKVLVCPGCAAIAGLTATDLREGAVMGTADSVEKLFLKADKVIDY
ncbi:MAG: DsrE family protein [Methylococcaceae bacterium]|nr:DsrE family protein [Methylococcaceae bacterium]